MSHAIVFFEPMHSFLAVLPDSSFDDGSVLDFGQTQKEVPTERLKTAVSALCDCGDLRPCGCSK